MKIQGYLSLCLLAMSVATAYADCDGCTDPTVTNPPVTRAPWKACPGGRSDLTGLLQQVAYLVNNILANAGQILSACSTNPNGPTILANLKSLLYQVQVVITTLIGGASLSNAQLATEQSTLTDVLQDITALLDSLLGGGKGTSWCCTSPQGLTGLLLNTIINIAVSLLNGIWSHDCGVLNGLMNEILVTLLSCQSVLV